MLLHRSILAVAYPLLRLSCPSCGLRQALLFRAACCTVHRESGEDGDAPAILTTRRSESDRENEGKHGANSDKSLILNYARSLSHEMENRRPNLGIKYNALSEEPADFGVSFLARSGHAMRSCLCLLLNGCN